MLRRVMRLSWLEIGAIIEPSYQSEGWRRSATFAVETATSHCPWIPPCRSVAGWQGRQPFSRCAPYVAWGLAITITCSTFMTQEIRFCLNADEAPALRAPMR
jgi:hypothetical protein